MVLNWIKTHRSAIISIIELAVVLYLIPLTYNQQVEYKKNIEECWNSTGFFQNKTPIIDARIDQFIANISTNTSHN